MAKEAPRPAAAGIERVRQLIEGERFEAMSARVALLERRLAELESRTDSGFAALRHWVQEEFASGTGRGTPLRRLLRVIRDATGRRGSGGD